MSQNMRDLLERANTAISKVQIKTMGNKNYKNIANILESYLNILSIVDMSTPTFSTVAKLNRDLEIADTEVRHLTSVYSGNELYKSAPYIKYQYLADQITLADPNNIYVPYQMHSKNIERLEIILQEDFLKVVNNLDDTGKHLKSVSKCLLLINEIKNYFK